MAGAPGPLPACSQGWPPGDCDPDPSASTLHFTQGAELRNRLQIYCSFFSRSGGGKERMIKDGGAQKQQLSTGEESRRSSSDPTSGVSGPTAGRSVLPVFSLISHRTLKSAGFIL